jgi:hypothetical protein
VSGRQALLHRGLSCLVLLAIFGTSIELAGERHWQTREQLLPWVALAVLAVAAGIFTLQRSAKAIRIVRLLALSVLPVAIFGIYAHVAANYNAGYLDAAYGNTWETLPPLFRWWHAFIKSVGPAPPLAPAMLAQTALLLLLASLTRQLSEKPEPISDPPQASRIR